MATSRKAILDLLSSTLAVLASWRLIRIETIRGKPCKA
jgi:hypothetical protein